MDLTNLFESNDIQFNARDRALQYYVVRDIQGYPTEQFIPDQTLSLGRFVDQMEEVSPGKGIRNLSNLVAACTNSEDNRNYSLLESNGYIPTPDHEVETVEELNRHVLLDLCWFCSPSTIQKICSSLRQTILPCPDGVVSSTCHYRITTVHYHEGKYSVMIIRLQQRFGRTDISRSGMDFRIDGINLEKLKAIVNF